MGISNRAADTPRRSRHPRASSAEPSQRTESASVTSGETSHLSASMCALLTSDTGWLRMVPAEHEVVYLKWKWDAGAHKGHYVMVQGYLGELAFLLDTLLRKREEVERGERTPTKDRFYGQQT